MENVKRKGRMFWSRGRKGQATTEVVLLLPLFMLFLFLFAKIFALLILVQKLEIASYYAARRWQLESHRNVAYEGFDNSALRSNILRYVNGYLGYGTAKAAFLELDGPGAKLDITRTQVWNIVTLTVRTKPLSGPVWKYLAPENNPNAKFQVTKGFKFEVTKYVPNRDRPIAFVLPGLKD